MIIGKITPSFNFIINVILCLQKFVILNTLSVILNLIQELKEAETSSA